MEWIFLEALLALLILIAIVWWTMGARKRDEPSSRSGDSSGRDGE